MKLGRFITRVAATSLVGVVLLGGLASAAPQSSNKSGSTNDVKTTGGSVQSYSADSVLQFGTVVELQTGGTKKVMAAKYKDLDQMFGVVVDPHYLAYTTSDDSLQNQTYVATSGTYNVLVSTQNGTIKSGDPVTMSAIDGVAMKAGTYDQQKTVLGRAASAFDGKSASVGNVTLKYDGGSGTKTVQLGLIPVAVNIQRNPNEKTTKVNLPERLQRVGQAIAEKPISPVRVYLSIGVTGLSIVVALVTLYAGVRNAIIAIGRNPLSKKSIFRGLLEIILTGFLILIIGLFAVYLLLKL